MTFLIRSTERVIYANVLAFSKPTVVTTVLQALLAYMHDTNLVSDEVNHCCDLNRNFGQTWLLGTVCLLHLVNFFLVAPAKCFMFNLFTSA